MLHKLETYFRRVVQKLVLNYIIRNTYKNLKYISRFDNPIYIYKLYSPKYVFKLYYSKITFQTQHSKEVYEKDRVEKEIVIQICSQSFMVSRSISITMGHCILHPCF